MMPIGEVAPVIWMILLCWLLLTPLFGMVVGKAIALGPERPESTRSRKFCRVPLRSGRRARVGGLMRAAEPRSSDVGERLSPHAGRCGAAAGRSGSDRAARFREAAGDSAVVRASKPISFHAGDGPPHPVVAVLAQHQDRALVVVNCTLVARMSPLERMDLLSMLCSQSRRTNQSAT